MERSGPPEIVTDDQRCRRNGGRGWRCPFPRSSGSSMCEKHLSLRKATDRARVRVSYPDMKKMKNKKKEGLPDIMDDGDDRFGKDGGKWRYCRSPLRNKEEVATVRVSDLPLKKRVGRPAKKHQGGEGDSSFRVSGTPIEERGNGVRVKEEPPSMNGEGAIGAMEVAHIWAFPQESDSCPRSYARIEKVFRTQVLVTPLIPHPISKEEMQFSDQGLSLGCGTFRASDSTITKEISSFKFRVVAKPERAGNLFYKIFPRKGEVWATYTLDGSSERVDFKLVDVLSDFSENDGISVAALVQVKGFGNDMVYRRQMYEGFYMVRTFSRSFMVMFSHRVPVSRIMEVGKQFWKREACLRSVRVEENFPLLVKS